MGKTFFLIIYILVFFLSLSSPAFAAVKTGPKAPPPSQYGGFSLTPTIGGFLFQDPTHPKATSLYGVKFGYDLLKTSIANSLGVEGTLNYCTPNQS